MYAVAFFKVVQQQTIGKVDNVKLSFSGRFIQSINQSIDGLLSTAALDAGLNNHSK